MDTIQTYWEIIIAERNWSWSLLGIAYLIVTMILRRMAMGPLIRRLKDLNRSQFEEIKAIYLKKSIFGWIIYLVSFIVVIGMWSREALFPLTVNEAGAVLGALVGFILSILFHVQALGTAAIVTLKDVVDKQQVV